MIAKLPICISKQANLEFFDHPTGINIWTKFSSYVCPNQSVAKTLAIFAGDQIRRDRRIKSLGVSPA